MALQSKADRWGGVLVVIFFVSFFSFFLFYFPFFFFCLFSLLFNFRIPRSFSSRPFLFVLFLVLFFSFLFLVLFSRPFFSSYSLSFFPQLFVSLSFPPLSLPRPKAIRQARPAMMRASRGVT